MTTASLTVTARQVEQLRDHLLREDEQERTAYVYTSRSKPDRYLAEEVVPVSDDELVAQSTTACRPQLPVERELLHDCTDRDMHPLIIHSHPFDGDGVPWFSDRDDTLMNGLQQMVTGLAPDTTVMFAVLGQQGIQTAVYHPATDQREPLPVTVLGNHTLDPPLETPDIGDGPADAAVTGTGERYDRNERVFGRHGQEQLAATHVAIVGVGGLGSLMAEELARLGIGELTLIDPDIIERSNLPRLFGAHNHNVGRPKVTAVKLHLQPINPGTTIHAVKEQVKDAVDALKPADLIVGGVDQVSARMFLNQFAVRHLIPYVDAGVVIETTSKDDADSDPPTVESMEGYIQRIIPSVTACFDCLGRADPERAYIERLSPEEREQEVERGYIDETTLSPEAAVVPVNGVVASKTVQTAVKHITGYSQPNDYIHVELTSNDLETLSTAPKPGCPTCGDNGVLGRGDRTPTMDEADVPDSLDLELGIDAESTAADTEPANEENIDCAVADAFATLFDTPSS